MSEKSVAKPDVRSVLAEHARHEQAARRAALNGMARAGGGLIGGSWIAAIVGLLAVVWR